MLKQISSVCFCVCVCVCVSVSIVSHRSIVGQHEARQRELILENSDLRASLKALEAEHARLLNTVSVLEADRDISTSSCGERPLSLGDVAAMRRELEALRETRGITATEEYFDFEDEPPEEYEEEEEDEDDA